MITLIHIFCPDKHEVLQVQSNSDMNYYKLNIGSKEIDRGR